MALQNLSNYPSTSVVTFLKERGFQPSSQDQFPYYDLRSQIFSKSGLTPTDKEYRGTSGVYVTLRNFLIQQEKKSGVSITPNNLWQVLGYGAQPTTGQGLKASVSDVNEQGSITNTMNYLDNQLVPPGTKATDIVDTKDSTKTKPETEYPTLSTDTLKYLFGETLSSEELLKQATESVTGSATYPLTQEAQTAEKSQLQIEKQRDTEKFIRDIASRGLIFSGAKSTGLQTIDADFLAKQFDIDRKYALLLAQGIQSAAQDIAKEAAKGNTDALTSLRSLGYDVNPLTGKIEPTLAAKKAEESETRAEAAQTRFETSQAATQERFEASQESMESRFQRTQERLAGGESFTKGGLPSGFFDAVDDTKKGLQSGTLDWGSAFNRIKGQFPGIDNATVDNYLGGQEGSDFWRTPGAYELSVLRTIQSYKDSGYKRDDIEDLYLQKGVPIPQSVVSALNQLFGKKK